MSPRLPLPCPTSSNPYLACSSPCLACSSPCPMNDILKTPLRDQGEFSAIPLYLGGEHSSCCLGVRFCRAAWGPSHPLNKEKQWQQQMFAPKLHRLKAASPPPAPM